MLRGFVKSCASGKPARPRRVTTGGHQGGEEGLRCADLRRFLPDLPTVSPFPVAMPSQVVSELGAS